MRYKVESYNYHNDVHECKGEDGSITQIDLLLTGDIGKYESKLDNMKQRTDLIGRKVEIERVSMYVGIGHGVRLVEEENGTS